MDQVKKTYLLEPIVANSRMYPVELQVLNGLDPECAIRDIIIIHGQFTPSCLNSSLTKSEVPEEFPGWRYWQNEEGWKMFKATSTNENSRPPNYWANILTFGDIRL